MQKNENDKNLKMLLISASILVGLFIYTLIKSSNLTHTLNYIYGLAFLAILIIISFFLNKYKQKLQENKNFSKLLSQTSSELSDNSVETRTILNPQSSILNPKSLNLNPKFTFNDIAGIESVKEELIEIVDFLKNPKKYTKFGIKLPKGVLLIGPPGVGKTLIAKALAGEAGVPFFYQSGASFVELYVGAGAKKVKELFNAAKAKAPAIIFIDEIDAIGKKRGFGSNDEREATLNELLTQMDGFESNSGVLVIAATNKFDVLDDALLRSGRFDRRVFINLPNASDRLKILKLYLKDKRYDFDIQDLAKNTAGFNSAALFTIINEALLNMVKRGDKVIKKADIELATKKVQFGKKELNIMCLEEKEVLATYQAAKAYITKTNLTLFDEGISEDECIYPSKTKLINQIKANLAGSIGVEVIMGESYVVFKSELKKAYEIAQMMEKDYKMGEAKNFIKEAKDSLTQTILTKKEEILKLKGILLEKEELDVF